MRYFKIIAIILLWLLITCLVWIKRNLGVIDVDIGYLLVFLFTVIFPTIGLSGVAKRGTYLIRPISLGIVLSMTAGLSMSQHTQTELATALSIMLGCVSVFFFVGFNKNIRTQSDIGTNLVFGFLPSIYFGLLAGYIGLFDTFTFPLITLALCTIFFEYYLTFIFSNGYTR